MIKYLDFLKYPSQKNKKMEVINLKNMKKLISFVLSFVMILASVNILGMLSVSAEDTSWDFYTVRNYTGDKAPSINDTTIFAGVEDSRVPEREFVSEYTPEGTDFALKLFAKKNALSTIYINNIQNATYGPSSMGALGMRMWVANPSDKVVCVNWQYVDNDGGRTAPIQDNRDYYLQFENNDKIYRYKTRTLLSNSSVLEIPAGFEGWIYVPYGATNFGNSDADPFTKIRFVFPNVDVDRDMVLYTSRIDYYSSTAFTETAYTDFDFDTVLPYTNYNSTDIDTNKVIAQPTGNAALDSVVRDGQNGQSMKVTFDTNNDNQRVRFRMFNLCKALANDSADGISFWVKNHHDMDIKISIMVNDGDKNLTKEAPYYIKADGDEAYTAYTVSSPSLLDNGARTAIVIPANFTGKVYLPYTLSSEMKNGVLDLHVCETDGVSTIILNFDNFRNYNFEEIGTLTTTTFDNLTSLDSVMWNYSGNTELSTEDTDGGVGNSVKAKISSTAAVGHRFKNLAPATDVATYDGRLGYRFWLSNPNDFDVNASTQFFDGYQRSLVGREYYLIYENGGSLVKKFQALHPTDAEVGCITIPANFRGYVYIPNNSIYNIANFPASNINAWMFVIAFLQAENDGYVYLDSYGMYAKEPTISRRQLPTVFSDGALFQQNKDINVWGFNLPGREVIGSLYKGDELIETVTATTDSEGRFETSFSALEGSYDKYRIEFSDADGVFDTANDILIGELWLSSGQSNMEFIVGATASSEEIIANANNENLRIFIEPKNQSLTENDDVADGYWINGTNTDNISRYTSAVALVFAYELEKEVKVPVGIINSAIGGTKIYEWFDREATAADEAMLQTIKDTGLYFELEDVESGNDYLWTRRYNTQIAPLEGLNIAGTIWYQGESDNYRYQYYAQKLDFLKESWGKIFGFENDDMPFIYTQVAPDVYNEATSDVFRLGYLAEAMTDAFKINENNNTAMLTIYDVPLDYGNEGEIHPNVKIPVGERFAQSAINLCYGGGKETSAPIFDSIEVKGNTIYVNFTHVGDGLSCLGEEIRGFNIAGEDGVYVNAKAMIIDNDTVMVWNDNLKAPKNVTYAFASMNQASNLVNSVGIPASPFRSDRTAATYMTIEEWMFADSDAWANVGGKQSGFKDSWTVSEGATYAYSEDVKTEGKASLAVSYTDTDAVLVSPVINTYRGKVFNLANYNSIKLDVKANAGATVHLLVNEELYASAEALENDGFNTVEFALGDDIEANATVSFYILDLSGETFYIDNISVGMTDKAAVFGDVNDDGALNAHDLVAERRKLLGLDCEVNLVKCDANTDGNINILDLIRIKKNILEIF